MKPRNYKKNEIPQDVDARIFQRLEKKFEEEKQTKPVKSFLIKSILPSITGVVSLVVVFAYVVLPFEGVRYARAAEKLIESDIQLIHSGETIRHQTITFTEGRDKQKVAEKLFPDFSQNIDLKRVDVLHQWSIKNANKGVVISNIETVPAQTYLFHENLYHYGYPECPQDLDSVACSAQIEIAAQDQILREYLDQTHNLSSLYTKELSHELDYGEVLEWISEMKYEKKEKIDGEKYVEYTINHSNELYSVLLFDIETGSLVSRDIFLILDDNSYHMSKVEYGDVSWIKSDLQNDIFNTSEYDYEIID